MATDADPRPSQADEFTTGELEVVGRVSTSSNVALLVRTESGQHAIYKPVRGERPLWDFPEGTLAGREVAAYLVSASVGWNLVPRTVLREGPAGLGSVQQWVGDPFAPFPHDRVVDLVRSGAVPDGWLPALEGETPTGQTVTVVHADSADVRSLAVLDAVINNSDRKGSHCLRDDAGVLHAIDHGVSFSPTPKLRTVLWGWAGEPLPGPDLARLERLADVLDDKSGRVAAGLASLLPVADLAALRLRVQRLLRSRRHPVPSADWPAVPWPPL